MRAAYPTRVTYGKVSGAVASKDEYHVWAANSANWNLPDGEYIMGAGQAAAMGVQKVRVMGTRTACAVPPWRRARGEGG